jgi:hypothetical protein
MMESVALVCILFLYDKDKTCFPPRVLLKMDIEAPLDLINHILVLIMARRVVGKWLKASS